MNSIVNFQKNRNFHSKAEKHRRLYLYTCIFPFHGNFCMDFYSVDSNEAMKQDDEALNASSLQFLSSVKRFIASSLQFLLNVKCFIELLLMKKII
jgi:hypothetical protein